MTNKTEFEPDHYVDFFLLYTTVLSPTEKEERKLNRRKKNFSSHE